MFLKKWYKAPTPLENHWDPPTMKTKKSILYEEDPLSAATDSDMSDKDVYARRTEQWVLYGSQGALLSYQVVGPQPDSLCKRP